MNKAQKILCCLMNNEPFFKLNNRLYESCYNIYFYVAYSVLRLHSIDTEEKHTVFFLVALEPRIENIKRGSVTVVFFKFTIRIDRLERLITNTFLMYSLRYACIFRPPCSEYEQCYVSIGTNKFCFPSP
jgi:hypothetical protein